MKIAYLSLDRGVPVHGTKGASVHIRELAKALTACGNQVTILAVNVGEALAPFQVKIIEVDGSGSSGEGFPKTGEEQALSEELRLDLLQTAILERLRALHAREGFDLIYERYSLWSAVGVRAATHLNVSCLVEVNAPLVVEQQRYRKLTSASEAKAIEAEVFGRADALLAVSQGVKAYAVANGADLDRTFIIPNAADPFRFHPAVSAEPVEGIDGSFAIGFVGSLKPWHGIDILLEAFRRLLRRSPDYHLLIVGDGPLKDWLKSTIQECHLERAVTLTGAVSHDRIPGLIQRLDVAVAPYPFMEDFYFSPLKLFEYMAMGKPIVASRIGQLEEVVRHGETGLLVQPGDPDALVEQIERLRFDQSLREAIGRAAALQARNYTWETNAGKVMDIADQLLGRRAA